MGASYNFCPGNHKGPEGLNIGFSQQIQNLIDVLRIKHKDKFELIRSQPMPYGKLFRGTVVEGKKKGYGEFYNGQNAYFGMFQNDRPHGEGMLIKQFRDYICGNFNYGRPDGQIKQRINKTQFHGHYYNGQKTKGVVRTEDYVYQGSFRDNRFNGYGIIEFNNGDRYEGDFLQGVYHGYGKYDTKQQGSYHGQFKNGLYDGKGKFIWNEDCFYEGSYKNGLRNGFGKFSKGKDQYQGFWINGQPQNNSRFINTNDNEQLKLRVPSQMI